MDDKSVGYGSGAVGQGIANVVMGNGLAVIGGQQIAPVAVAVGVIDRVLRTVVIT